MFTASFLAALAKIALPALVSILSMAASKYLDKQDKPILAALVRYVPLAGLALFYVLPQLDTMADDAVNALDLGDMSQPADQISAPPTTDIRQHLAIRPEAIHQVQAQAVQPQPDNSAITYHAPKGKFHVDLPYLDYTPEYKPMDLKPLHNEINEWTNRMLKPSVEMAKSLQQVNEINATPFLHLTGFLHNGWEIIKDVVVR